MNHRATPRFWGCYQNLPDEVRQLADRCYETMRENERHPFLQLKRVGAFWSVRVGLHYRALAVEEAGTLIWVWIGSHAEYDKLIRGNR